MVLGQEKSSCLAKEKKGEYLNDLSFSLLIQYLDLNKIDGQIL